MTDQGQPDVPEWLVEVLHLVQAIADREHVSRPGHPAQLAPGHAEAALAAVPREVLDAAEVRHAVARA